MKSYVIVIFGPSGSGKTTLMEMLVNSGGQYSIHKKYSDRPPRQYDDVELEYVQDFNPELYDYVYQTYGFRYGIQREQIEKSIKDNRHHFIICNDISTIKSLKRDYRDLIKTVFMFFDAPDQVLHSIQKDRGITDDEIGVRMAKTSVLYRIYAENTELFDATLPNYYQEEPHRRKERLESILIRFSERGYIDPPSNVALPNQQVRPAVLEDYAFIIMPIRDDDHSNIDIHEAIKRSCKKLGINAERVDEIQYTGQITEKNTRLY